MPQLVILTGPIAAGKNTVAGKLAERLTGRGKTVVVADVDDIAAMVATPGAAQAGLWFAAHEAHGALVGQWMRSSVEYVVAVGPIYTAEEQAALTRTLPDEAAVLWVVIDATVAVTFARAQADPGPRSAFANRATPWRRATCAAKGRRRPGRLALRGGRWLSP
jgi:adenylylsulfate kinase-like enzyme